MSSNQKILEKRWQEALKKLAKIFGEKNLKKSEVDLVKSIQKNSLAKFKAKKKPKFIILTGASGVGKNEIAKELNKKIIRLPHVTSRKPRKGEKQGREYFFISQKEFQKRIKEGRFLAYRETYGDYRGVSKDYFLKYLKEKKLFFIERTIPAFLEFITIPLIKKTPFCNVYILPSSFQDLKSRINKRAQKDKSLSKGDIHKRLIQAVEHLEILANKSTAKKSLYNLFLVNPQVKNKKELKLTAKKITDTIYQLVK